MAERLALAVIPGVGWSAAETQAIAQEAEAAGFDAIVAAEVNNDVMATAQLMGAATCRIGRRRKWYRSTWRRWDRRRSSWAASWRTGSCRCSGRRSGWPRARPGL